MLYLIMLVTLVFRPTRKMYVNNILLVPKKVNLLMMHKNNDQVTKYYYI